LTPHPGTSRLPDLGGRGEGWFVGQLLLMGSILVLSLPVFPHVTDDRVRLLGMVLGALALVTGGAVAVLGIRELGESLSPMPRPRRRAQLVETGVYRLIRHPIYAGLMVAGIGWVGLTGSLAALPAALGLIVFLDLKARREEAWLVERFPGYAEYRNRSKRFVPGLY